jgi:hypothetical protein
VEEAQADADDERGQAADVTSAAGGGGRRLRERWTDIDRRGLAANATCRAQPMRERHTMPAMADSSGTEDVAVVVPVYRLPRAALEEIASPAPLTRRGRSG